MAKSDEVFEEARMSMKEYVDSVEPIKKQRKQRRLKRKIMIAALVVGLAAGAAWYFLIREPSVPASPQTAQTNQPAENEEPDEQVVDTTESYVSQAFSLTLDYPTNWEVDDTITSRLMIVSPKTNLKDGSGQDIEVRIIVQIRAKGAKLMELPTEGTITAIKASQKMAYARPSSVQRGETYLTFAQINGAGLTSVYITGDNGYEESGFIPAADLAKADPLVSVSFIQCAKVPCTIEAGTDLKSVDLSEWDSNPYLQQAKTLLQALVIS